MCAYRRSLPRRSARSGLRQQALHDQVGLCMDMQALRLRQQRTAWQVRRCLPTKEMAAIGRCLTVSRRTMLVRTGDEWPKRSRLNDNQWYGACWGVSTERSQQLLGPLGVLARA
jgi:hypothetical protein